jgi:hypothetical protein
LKPERHNLGSSIPIHGTHPQRHVNRHIARGLQPDFSVSAAMIVSKSMAMTSLLLLMTIFVT